MSKKPEKHPLNALPRNYTAEAMRKRYAGKGGAMKSRNVPRGGQRNEQRDILDEYDQYFSRHEESDRDDAGSMGHCPSCTCKPQYAPKVSSNMACKQRVANGTQLSCALKRGHKGTHEAWAHDPDELLLSWEAPNVPSSMVCGEESVNIPGVVVDGWSCSLKRCHMGKHEAWAYDPDELMASW